jgi:hypothetical protein
VISAPVAHLTEVIRGLLHEEGSDDERRRDDRGDEECDVRTRCLARGFACTAGLRIGGDGRHDGHHEGDACRAGNLLHRTEDGRTVGVEPRLERAQRRREQGVNDSASPSERTVCAATMTQSGVLSEKS